MIDREELAWLGGLIDGEGCFKISVFRVKESSVGFSVKCVVSIGNTDLELLNKVEDIWNKLGFSVSKDIDKRDFRKEKIMYYIKLQTIEDVKYLAKLLLDNNFITGKTKQQYIIFIDEMVPLLDSRPIHPFNKNLKCWTKPLFLKALEIREKISKLKGSSSKRLIKYTKKLIEREFVDLANNRIREY